MRLTKKAARIAVPLLFLAMIVLLSGCESMMVMNPKGPIAAGQKDLIIIATILCAIVLVPVLILTAYIVWRYRDKPDNKAAYKPNWSHSTKMEIVWWGIPIVIIIALAAFTARDTYALEPSKPIASDKKPITIQATSLDWKWLFTYPEQGIATVNYIEIPEDTPIKFELTSDAPMNSFWIPQLGGQMYTMSGMAMTLFLQADEQGDYFGTGANFSGKHFADMKFQVHATSNEEFNNWINEVKKKSNPLTEEGYNQLALPGTSDRQLFSSFPEGLFNRIVTKYVTGGGHAHHGSTESGEAAKQEQPKAADPKKSGMDSGSTDMKQDHSQHAAQ
ncbi:ubiquinol oxidase subunit II [Paenibacillus doosanensis]|uniref:Quinol oxidase subunit 2 n=1 Tax=Paenibacillus konkukensis TaxID=2020716 RepID=A0ABY4RWM9_9BACL|nr:MULTISPECIES: ubiquinol oxidase subunit II [Paenibacillus]MCS7464870.1 ubiquinol oxidase subunit II [Paenibacillus doosanensis]UQZ86096.1 Cytochrome bo(3) ubiquinol oxidase subunit 2 precursor [Paenibacillus konkukensis]